uniref:Uncharacterized protein n=1 Tax=Arundo donax TaxID=35708 RepID=A0A0A9HP84_ARUDO
MAGRWEQRANNAFTSKRAIGIGCMERPCGLHHAIGGVRRTDLAAAASNRIADGRGQRAPWIGGRRARVEGGEASRQQFAAGGGEA